MLHTISGVFRNLFGCRGVPEVLQEVPEVFQEGSAMPQGFPVFCYFFFIRDLQLILRETSNSSHTSQNHPNFRGFHECSRRFEEFLCASQKL